MTLQTAIQQRIADLYEERKDALTDDMEVIERICDVFGISLADFFCCDTFRNLEPAK